MSGSRGSAARQGVPSEYHCATLVGNWAEERTTFGKPPPPETVHTATTYATSFKPIPPADVSRAKPASCFSAEAPRELLFFHGNVEKPEKNIYSMHELNYTDRRKEHFTNKEVLDMTGTSKRRAQTEAVRCGVNGVHSEIGDGADSTNGGGRNYSNSAVHREATFLRSLNATRAGANPSSLSDTQSTGYVPPSLTPVGRVADRDRLLSTKQVTIDATGEYLHEHLQSYPLTTSVSVGAFVKSCDNPMHKTGLRCEYAPDV